MVSVIQHIYIKWIRDNTIFKIRVLNNIEAVLKEANYDFSDIIKTTIFLTNMEDFNVVNEIYGKKFEKEFAPARETVEVSGLPKNAKIEISIIAKK